MMTVMSDTFSNAPEHGEQTARVQQVLASLERAGWYAQSNVPRTIGTSILAGDQMLGGIIIVGDHTSVEVFDLGQPEVLQHATVLRSCDPQVVAARHEGLDRVVAATAVDLTEVPLGEVGVTVLRCLAACTAASVDALTGANRLDSWPRVEPV
jgi:hypothetical protein